MASEPPDTQPPHLVLGVEPDASEGEIRAAYKRLALKWHPDLNRSKGAGERMAEINAAFDAMTGRRSYPPAPGGPPPPPAYAGGMTEDELRHTIVACERCGRSDTTLRVSVMVVVRSFIGTWRRGTAELLCEDCRSRAALSTNAQSALLGWWGWAGIVLTPVEALRNARGGRQVREVNDEILLALGQTRGARGDSEGREEALRERLSVSADPSGVGRKGRLRGRGAALSLVPTAVALLAIAGAITALVITAGPTAAQTKGSIEATRAALNATEEAWSGLPDAGDGRCSGEAMSAAESARRLAVALETPSDAVGKAAVSSTRRATGSVSSSLDSICPQLPYSTNAQIDSANELISGTNGDLDSAVQAFNRWVDEYNDG